MWLVLAPVGSGWCSVGCAVACRLDVAGVLLDVPCCRLDMVVVSCLCHIVVVAQVCLCAIAYFIFTYSVHCLIA